MFDLSKLHNLELYKTVDKQEMLCKLIEEVKEVEFELVVPQSTNCALAGELLDVMQVCLGIAYTNGIDLNDYVEFHNAKLLTRQHKFIK